MTVLNVSPSSRFGGASRANIGKTTLAGAQLQRPNDVNSPVERAHERKTRISIIIPRRPEAKLAGSKMPRLGTLPAISTTGFADVWGQFERQTELRLPPSALHAAPATTAEPNTPIGALGVGWTRRQRF
eukprot:scaffold11319_cov61-Phaeocystis_antarctica.AAC.2